MEKPRPVIPLAALRFDRIVREARELAGLSQAGLAREAGVSRDRVARVEQGLGSTTVRDVEALLVALGRHGVALMPDGRVDLADAPRWTQP